MYGSCLEKGTCSAFDWLILVSASSTFVRLSNPTASTLGSIGKADIKVESRAAGDPSLDPQARN